VVGNGQAFGAPLASIGTVNEIDVAITTPKVEMPEASADDLAMGRSILDRAVVAAGGLETFRGLQSIQEKGSATMVTPQGEIRIGLESTMAFPDRFRVVMSLPQGEMVQIMKGEQVWLVTPMGPQPAPPPMKESMINNTWQDLAYLYRRSDQEGLSVQYLGSEDVNGSATEVILVNPPGIRSFKMYFDASTMLPIKRSSQEMTPNGPMETVEFLSDYREIGGLMLPYRTLIMRNGEKAGEATITEILINPELSDDMFTVER
jgi:outer membrane lipoprotein-sorting protein